MKKSIVLSILSLLVWSGSAQIASGFQETDNPFPPVLPNPPEIPAEEKQEEGKDGPIVIDLTQPSDVPAQGIPQNPTEGLSELTPDGPTEQVLPEPESDQKVLVREKFAGWTEAGMGENGSVLGEQLRANWVLLGNNGLLQGQVLGGAQVNAAKVPVYLLSRGRVVTQTRTDADGNFSFGNVQQGTYSLVGFGEDAFFAFGFNAIDYAESIQFRMPSKILVQAVENKTTINLDWIRYFAPNLQFRVYGRFVSKQGSADPAALYGVDGLALLAPQSAPATSVQVHPVSLTEDGELVGRVHQIDELNGRPVDVRGVRTILIQNDKVVAAASTDNFGVFSIDGVTPGDYSIVAVGNDGMGCIGIRVVANESEENARPVDFSLVSPETAGWLNHVATEVAYQRIVGRKRPESTEQCQQCGNAIPSMMNGVCGACGVCQECGGHTQYGMCGGCGTGCFGGGYGGGFGCGLRHHGGFGYGAAPYGYGAGCGSYGYGGYGGGYGYGGGRSGANGFQQFWKDINACFDMCFYGETFAYGYGNNGYGNGGYGQGGYGGYGQGAPYGYGNGGYGMDPNCPPGAYPMQGQYNGVYSGESLPGVYSPVVPEVPAVEAPQSPLVPTPASPANGY